MRCFLSGSTITVLMLTCHVFLANEHRYNMEWLRAEGFAVASEELFMIAGVLDDRPRRGREIPYLMVSVVDQSTLKSGST